MCKKPSMRERVAWPSHFAALLDIAEPTASDETTLTGVPNQAPLLSPTRENNLNVGFCRRF